MAEGRSKVAPPLKALVSFRELDSEICKGFFSGKGENMKELFKFEKTRQSLRRRLRVVTSTMSGVVDRILLQETQLSITEFIEHAKANSAAVVKVIPFIAADCVYIGLMSAPGTGSIPVSLTYITLYRSYEDTGKELGICEESHFKQNYQEDQSDNDTRNFLTAQKRGKELTELMPGICVQIVIPSHHKRSSIRADGTIQET